MNAIILAAGMGTRLNPITDTTPKSLIAVNNKPLIETQIEYLAAIGVQKIIIVVGYLADKFDYLLAKYATAEYELKIVLNEHYSAYNNIYTMSLVIEELADSYVIDADVFMARNFLIDKPSSSLYFSGEKDSVNEWALLFDGDDKVTAIKDSDGVEYIMSGVSYWSKQDATLLAAKLNDKICKNQDDWKNLYWDDIVKENISLLSVKIAKITGDDWYEIDSLTDYQQALALFPNN